MDTSYSGGVLFLKPDGGYAGECAGCQVDGELHEFVLLEHPNGDRVTAVCCSQACADTVRITVLQPASDAVN